MIAKGAIFTPESAVVDGRLITGRGAGHAVNFGLAILEVLKGKETADRVRAGLTLLRDDGRTRRGLHLARAAPGPCSSIHPHPASTSSGLSWPYLIEYSSLHSLYLLELDAVYPKSIRLSREKYMIFRCRRGGACPSRKIIL